MALRGLIRHHGVDTLDFDRRYHRNPCPSFSLNYLLHFRCDQTLPLEDMIKPDPKLRKLLEDIDRSKARVWALTNAYVVVSKYIIFKSRLKLVAKISLISTKSTLREYYES